jgi:hypothetical protein
MNDVCHIIYMHVTQTYHVTTLRAWMLGISHTFVTGPRKVQPAASSWRGPETSEIGGYSEGQEQAMAAGFPAPN